MQLRVFSPYIVLLCFSINKGVYKQQQKNQQNKETMEITVKYIENTVKAFTFLDQRKSKVIKIPLKTQKVTEISIEANVCAFCWYLKIPFFIMSIFDLIPQSLTRISFKTGLFIFNTFVLCYISVTLVTNYFYLLSLSAAQELLPFLLQNKILKH